MASWITQVAERLEVVGSYLAALNTRLEALDVHLLAGTPRRTITLETPLSRMIAFAVLQGVVAFIAFWFWPRNKGAEGEKSSGTHEKSSSNSDSEKDRDVNKGRELGEWTPQHFTYPPITPCPYPLEEVRPVPYRPFRWGEYHITMGIRSMPWSEWIELDESYTAYHRVREYRIRTRGHDAIKVLGPQELENAQVGGGADAAKELLYELAEYLPRRYPAVFSITRHPSGSSHVPEIGGVPLSWDGLPPIKTIEVGPTGARFDLSVLEGMEGVEMGEEAMRIAALLVQEDIALMIEGSDGKYYFQAGAICIPGFWRMRDKLGMPLDEIHVSGNVPKFKEKLQMSMERFFKRMPLDKPVIRNNYFIQVVKPTQETGTGPRLDVEEETASDVDPEELGWSESTNGKEDEFQHGHGHAALPAPYLAPSTLRLRSERQTLRRLPRTGAIVFGIRTYLFKIEELGRERGVPGRLASAVRSWPDDVGVYKGRKMYREVLVRYLDECAERDVENEVAKVEYPF
ncbi:hypothetical protein BV22DRAFT_1027620 [Leucogyrophana mollusca]|uniref:Uncharacterized protein n=1 Tax=Leucogyrophana mollusca TaxID=85980 RepID=A0ACB8C1U1_9AGAM|nr:hypothetical protein BV22DRAFT_1027620 [Leucogyrophana mollusca]